MYHCQNGGVRANGKLTPVERETTFNEKGPSKSSANGSYGVVSVEYETREGSGKFDKDFKYTQGTLVGSTVKSLIVAALLIVATPKL